MEGGGEKAKLGAFVEGDENEDGGLRSGEGWKFGNESAGEEATGGRVGEDGFRIAVGDLT